jgi:hypothetical protein
MVIEQQQEERGGKEPTHRLTESEAAVRRIYIPERIGSRSTRGLAPGPFGLVGIGDRSAKAKAKAEGRSGSGGEQPQTYSSPPWLQPPAPGMRLWFPGAPLWPVGLKF